MLPRFLLCSLTRERRTLPVTLPLTQKPFTSYLKAIVHQFFPSECFETLGVSFEAAIDLLMPASVRFRISHEHSRSDSLARTSKAG